MNLTKHKRKRNKRQTVASLLRANPQVEERLALVSKFPLTSPVEITYAETAWQPVPSVPRQGDEGVAAFALVSS